MLFRAGWERAPPSIVHPTGHLLDEVVGDPGARPTGRPPDTGRRFCSRRNTARICRNRHTISYRREPVALQCRWRPAGRRWSTVGSWCRIGRRQNIGRVDRQRHIRRHHGQSEARPVMTVDQRTVLAKFPEPGLYRRRDHQYIFCIGADFRLRDVSPFLDPVARCFAALPPLPYWLITSI